MTRWTPAALLLALPLFACGDKDSDGATAAADEDGDGYTTEFDCDDADAAVNPGADEICDGADNDCDGDIDDADDSLLASSTQSFFADADADGHGDATASVQACSAPAGAVDTSDDCDDTDPDTYTGADEICDDGIDNTCNLVLDCDDTTCTADAACAPTLVSVDPASGYYAQPNAIVITGAGFAWATAGTPTVTVGALSAADVVVVDDETLTATVPAAAGPARGDVTVTNANGDATLAGAFSWTDCLYAATGRGGIAGNLYCIAPSTGDVTTIGPLPVGFTGLAFAPDGTLYGTSSSEGSRGALYTIDPATAAATEVGPLDSAASGDNYSSTPDITFVGSRLIAWAESNVDGGGDDPVQIDTATGAVTKIVLQTDEGTSSTGMAHDGSGTVYLLESGLDGELWTVGATDGAMTLVGSLDATAVPDLDSSGGATFHDGTLYSLACEGGADGACSLATVNPTTLVVTDLGYVLPVGLDALAAPSF